MKTMRTMEMAIDMTKVVVLVVVVVVFGLYRSQEVRTMRQELGRRVRRRLHRWQHAACVRTRARPLHE